MNLTYSVLKKFSISNTNIISVIRIRSNSLGSQNSISVVENKKADTTEIKESHDKIHEMDREFYSKYNKLFTVLKLRGNRFGSGWYKYPYRDNDPEFDPIEDDIVSEYNIGVKYLEDKSNISLTFIIKNRVINDQLPEDITNYLAYCFKLAQT